jgi:transposase-like protein
MECPKCHSRSTRKDGYQNGKQGFECEDCGSIFREFYHLKRYHPQVQKICLQMYLNGRGFRGIERVTDVHHITIMNWVKESAENLPEDEGGYHPIVVWLNELQTYIGSKSYKI